MIQEVITKVVITADDGKILTNGETYAKKLVLGEWDKAENYHEITEKQYQKILAKQNEENNI